MTSSLTITHARVVLPDQVVDNGAVVIREGVIAEVHAAEHLPASGAILDAAGAYLIPGLIDTHNDSLESEINPRPSVNLPRPFALANYERRALAAGVTTSFHAISFAEVPSKKRTLGGAEANAAAVREAGERGLIDHQILHRCDVWTPFGLDPLFASLRACNVRALSINDHMPGQGQFRDVEQFKQWIASYRASDPSFDAEAEIERRVALARADRQTVPRVLERVRSERERTPMIVVSHDDDSVEKVDQMVETGATVAEFPITPEAARRAREHGMHIVVGAPNIVRGGSTNGNLSGRELVASGFGDIICADYHTPSLILAALTLVDLGLCDLPSAIAKLTINPARAFGLADRGSIQPGLRADLCLLDTFSGLPRVRTVLRGGRVVFSVDATSDTSPVPAGAGCS